MGEPDIGTVLVTGGASGLGAAVAAAVAGAGGMHTAFFDSREERNKPPADAKLNRPEDVTDAVLFAFRQPPGCEVRELVVASPWRVPGRTPDGRFRASNDGPVPRRREQTMSIVENNWEPHDHEALVHTHRHYHVTHNFREMTGGFEHLSSAHEHEHDHAAVNHSHHPHENFESEHAGEAHVHDHDAPVDVDGQAAPKAKKAPARKAAKAAASDN